MLKTEDYEGDEIRICERSTSRIIKKKGIKILFPSTEDLESNNLSFFFLIKVCRKVVTTIRSFSRNNKKRKKKKRVTNVHDSI